MKRVQLHLRNKSVWYTPDLRDVTLALLKYRGYSGAIKVQVENGRTPYVNGLAYTREHLVYIRPPKREMRLKEFCQVFLHEVDHLYGLRHPDMAKVGSLTVPESVTSMQVRRAVDVRKQKVVDVRSVRYRKVLSKVDKLQTRLKRLTNKLRKLEKRRKYYERAGVMT
jgi:hypothetical protein